MPPIQPECMLHSGGDDRPEAGPDQSNQTFGGGTEGDCDRRVASSFRLAKPAKKPEKEANSTINLSGIATGSTLTGPLPDSPWHPETKLPITTFHSKKAGVSRTGSRVWERSQQDFSLAQRSQGSFVQLPSLSAKVAMAVPGTSSP